MTMLPTNGASPGSAGIVGSDPGESPSASPAGRESRRSTSWGADELDEILTILRQQAIAVCDQASRTPVRVRAGAGDIFVEVAWSPTPAIASGAMAGPGSGPAREPVPVPGREQSRPEPARAQIGPVRAEPDTDVHVLRAGTVGVFYRASEPGAKPFVAEGDTIVRGQQVAIIEAMKLMIPVEADVSGRVVELFVTDGTAVEHGEPLLAVAAGTTTGAGR